MKSSNTSTALAVSPDSGTHWTAEGAWKVIEGVYRIPLPFPMDGLKAVNVYAIETTNGLTMIDGGWAIDAARDLLEQSLASLGYACRDITRFLVTHIHRDHYTLASVLGHELGVNVALGAAERSGMDLINDHVLLGASHEPHVALKLAGAFGVAEEWAKIDAERSPLDPAHWQMPDTWLDGDQPVVLGDRTLHAVHTPGHTPGHFVYADLGAGVIFTGDHVLPTITPSIGFTLPPPVNPLGDFMASLTKLLAFPNLRILPSHGPVGMPLHTRVHELLAFHEERLRLSLAALGAGLTTAFDVARALPWTRHARAYDSLDSFNQGMAAMETVAHLELLVVIRGQATQESTDEGFIFALAPAKGDER